MHPTPASLRRRLKKPVHVPAQLQPSLNVAAELYCAL